MFKVDDRNVIRIIQGDTGVLSLKLESYILQEGDTVVFTVVDKNVLVDMGASRNRSAIRKEIDEFGPEGTAIIKLESEDTEDLTPKTYSYDIQVNTRDGRVDTVVPANKFIVLEGISR